MANIYDQNVKLQAIADAITNQSITITTGQDLLDALADIANAMQPAAANITYDNTNSGLQAVNVQQAVDENADNISTLNSSKADKLPVADIVVPVTGRNVANCIYYIFTKIDYSKLSIHSCIKYDGIYLRLIYKSSSQAMFSYCYTTLAGFGIVSFNVQYNANTATRRNADGTIADIGTASCSSMELYY